MISFLFTIPNECVEGKPTISMQLVLLGRSFCCVLSNPFVFTSLKVSVFYCLSAHEAITRLRTQLGRRCLDVLHLFPHLAFPDTFSSTCTFPLEQVWPRSHSLKAKTGSHLFLPPRPQNNGK